MIKLVDNNGQVIVAGDKVRCFRGEEHTVQGFQAPRHEGSSGRVIVETSDGFRREFFPSVFNLKIEVNHEAQN